MNKPDSFRLFLHPSSFILSATGSCQSSQGLLAWTGVPMDRVYPPKGVIAGTDSREGTDSSRTIELSMGFDRSTPNGWSPTTTDNWIQRGAGHEIVLLSHRPCPARVVLPDCRLSGPSAVERCDFSFDSIIPHNAS